MYEIAIITWQGVLLLLGILVGLVLIVLIKEHILDLFGSEKK